MTYAAQLIDATIQATGLSQAALAKALGLAAPQVSKWRHGTSPIPEDKLAAMFELAHLDEAAREYYTLGVMRDAVTTTGVMRALDGVLDRLRPALARVGMLMVVSLAAFGPTPSEAANLNAGPFVHYAKLLIRRLREAVTVSAARLGYGPSAVLA